jgi:hypothetical protein
VDGAGQFEVAAIPDSTHVTLENVGFPNNPPAGNTVAGGVNIIGGQNGPANAYTAIINTPLAGSTSGDISCFTTQFDGVFQVSGWVDVTAVSGWSVEIQATYVDIYSVPRTISLGTFNSLERVMNFR